MSVLIETSLGDLVIDLYTNEAPLTCKNFLKLCKLKYYNFSRIHRVEQNYIAQMGDPQGTGHGGQSIFGVLGGMRYFPAEHNGLKHLNRGTVSMAVTQQQQQQNNKGDGVSGSQFFITLGDKLEYLDGRHTVFGKVVEGLETLDAINNIMCDAKNRPLRDILLRHTVVLHDPFDDPKGFVEPVGSPLMPSVEQMQEMRIEAGDELEPTMIDETEQRKREARAQALTLEMIGDLPYADVKPAENVLFVCKLNPATQDDDLKTIFARFGTITSCEVVRDRESGHSLGYAFVEFEETAACEEAYFKMDNVLVDDRRIHVDFSQSVGRYNGRWVNSAQVRNENRGLVRRNGRYRDAGKSGDGEKSGYQMVFDADDLGRQGRRQDQRVAKKRASSSRWDSGRKDRSRSPHRQRSDRR
ncbi:Peptidyl-prolyl cis-trans isomerase-like 4 [Coemansia sp. IMI 203386]|nr:Peptidyl-prolyl cis-trans isomerase-like 4 [Coemansia sp. IMI 203386]